MADAEQTPAGIPQSQRRSGQRGGTPRPAGATVNRFQGVCTQQEWDQLQHFAESRLGPVDAEDVMQEFWVTANALKQQGRLRNGVRSLFAVVYNKIREAWRARARGKAKFVRLSQKHLAELAGRSRPDGSRDLSRCLRSCLEKLPVGDREILRLHDAEGLTFQAISQMLGCSLSTAHARFDRAKKRLRRCLAAALRQD